MMDPIVHEYYELVKRYCSLVEGLIISRDLIEELMSILLQLYEKALHLPNLEVRDVAVESFVGVLPLKMEIPDYYWQVFNLFNEEEEDKLCGGMISDDINDIYRDLMQGVAEYEIGEIGDAVFDWKEGAGGHWGDHAVRLIKALHWLRYTH